MEDVNRWLNDMVEDIKTLRAGLKENSLNKRQIREYLDDMKESISRITQEVL